jgi:hypothetical protein
MSLSEAAWGGGHRRPGRPRRPLGVAPSPRLIRMRSRRGIEVAAQRIANLVWRNGSTRNKRTPCSQP